MPRRGERAAEVGELLGVHFHRHAERARRREQPLGLRDAEGDALAEHVDGVHQALARAAPAATRARRRRCNHRRARWYSGGTVCAARSVVRTVTGKARPSSRATRSILASSASVSP